MLIKLVGLAAFQKRRWSNRLRKHFVDNKGPNLNLKERSDVERMTGKGKDGKIMCESVCVLRHKKVQRIKTNRSLEIVHRVDKGKRRKMQLNK